MGKVKHEASYSLARSVLANVRTIHVTEEDKAALGEAIQQTIEDFISALLAGQEPQDGEPK